MDEIIFLWFFQTFLSSDKFLRENFNPSYGFAQGLNQATPSYGFAQGLNQATPSYGGFINNYDHDFNKGNFGLWARAYPPFFS
jgi:hypothetical protein